MRDAMKQRAGRSDEESTADKDLQNEMRLQIINHLCTLALTGLCAEGKEQGWFKLYDKLREEADDGDDSTPCSEESVERVAFAALAFQQFYALRQARLAKENTTGGAP